MFLPARADVKAERVLRIQGYTNFAHVRPAILKAAEAAANLVPDLATPRVAYRYVPIADLDDGTLRLAGDVQLHCAAFGRVLAGCTEVVAFALTLGPTIDQRVADLSAADKLLDALLLDAAAWLGLEDATRQFQRHLRHAAASSGRRITSRMAPGCSYRVGAAMCNWPLEEQANLFALLDLAELPVVLLDSGAMQPKMSRSGIIGVAPVT